jgi:tetratricopeptide (TPR) repeat protein
LKTGREAVAILAFETTIKLNPRYSYAYDNLGWIYLRRNQMDTSLEYLNQSLALRPENGWALYNRGRIYFQKGHVDAAFQDAEAACRLGFKKACQLLKRHGRETQS